jgi:hypothetical protein
VSKGFQQAVAKLMIKAYLYAGGAKNWIKASILRQRQQID